MPDSFLYGKSGSQLLPSLSKVQSILIDRLIRLAATSFSIIRRLATPTPTAITTPTTAATAARRNPLVRIIIIIPAPIGVPAGVGIPQRIVQRIRVAVEGLGRGRVGDDGIGLGEAPEQRVVPAGAVEIEPQRLFVILPGETFGCQGAMKSRVVSPEKIFVQLRETKYSFS